MSIKRDISQGKKGGSLQDALSGGRLGQRLLVAVVLFSVVLVSACGQAPKVPRKRSAATATQAPVAPRATQAPAATPSGGTAPVALGEGLIFGAQVSPKEIGAVCSQAQELGVKATVVWIPWNILEPQKGNYRWDVLDNALGSLERCGITNFGIHFQSRSRWATVQAPGGGDEQSPSSPPKDMDDYYQVLFDLATHLKGRVKRYSVENEASATWPSSSPIETYFQMLDTAYKAIKAADPDAIVMDSGTGSNGFGFLIADTLLKEGRDQEAVQFVNEYYINFPIGRKPIDMSSAADIQQFMTDPILQRVLEWMPMLFANQSRDALQIHFYNGWQKLLPVIEWVRQQQQAAGVDRPIELWELGYGWQNPDTLDRTAQAQDTVKLLAIAAGEGSKFTIYWPLLDKVERRTPGLVYTNGEITPAGVAYRVTVQMLAGSTSAQRVDLGNPAVWAYRFTRDGRDTYVVWGTASATVSLPIEAATVTITDVSGNASSGNPKALAVGVSPVFAQAP